MFVEQMTRISGWVAATAPSRAVQEMEGYIPATQSLHILAICAVVAAAMMINLRVLGLMNRDLGLIEVCLRYRGLLRLGVIVLATTGFGLLLAEPERSLVSQVFQLKMLLLVGAILCTVILHRRAALHGTAWDGAGIPVAARTLAAAGLLLWIGIIFSGRWIAYAQY